MLWMLRSVGGTLGHLAFWCGVRSRVTIDNLGLAFPEWTSARRRQVAVKSYISLGKVFVEFLFLRYASKKTIERGLEITNLAEIKSYLSGPSGAILLSGHIGNWEWLALGCGLRLDVPLDVIIKNQRSRFAERFLVRMRSRFGNRMLNAGHVIAIFRALRNRELLAILGDQAAPVEDVRVPFFGMEVPTLEGTARLALATRAPILFLQPYERTACGYRCRFHNVPFDDLEDASPDNVRELTARHTAVLERSIRACPEFWLWQHKRWKHANGQPAATH
jgi:Kdo2-lipid IVA lauroyltransferase/acyltransferase